MTRHILVTGGCGFVGRHLVNRLAKESESEIWVIDNLSTGIHPTKWEVPQLNVLDTVNVAGLSLQVPSTDSKIHFIRADFVAVAQSELGIIPELGLPPLPQFDEVYHLASVVGGRNVIDNDPLAVGIDLSIDSVFFLWAARVNRPGRILYASSSAAYPVDLQEAGRSVPLREDMISFVGRLGVPDYTYGWSKLTGEYLGQIAVHKYGLSVGVVRPFSGYGEDQEPVYPFPAIALRVAARQNPVRVWGSGHQARDFVHIDDACEVAISCCRTVSDGSAVNIGSGKLTSFRELAARMIEIEGYEASVVGMENKPVGVAERFCDPTRMKSTLAAQLRIPMDEGIRRCLAYARERLKRGVQPD